MLVGLWETEDVGTVPENPRAGNQLSIKNVQVCACVLTGVLGMKPHGTEQIIFDYRYTRLEGMCLDSAGNTIDCSSDFLVSNSQVICVVNRCFDVEVQTPSKTLMKSV